MNLSEALAKDPQIAERFWAKVDRRGDDECWPWTGTVGAAGYAHIRVGGRRGRNVQAHRLAFAIAGGDVENVHVLHSCDYPICCNPAHHRAGNHAENMAEMSARGRNRTPRPGNGYQKIFDRAAIVARFAETHNKSQVAREFKITPTRVRQIINEQGL